MAFLVSILKILFYQVQFWNEEYNFKFDKIMAIYKFPLIKNLTFPIALIYISISASKSNIPDVSTEKV